MCPSASYCSNPSPCPPSTPPFFSFLASVERFCFKPCTNVGKCRNGCGTAKDHGYCTDRQYGHVMHDDCGCTCNFYEQREKKTESRPEPSCCLGNTCKTKDGAASCTSSLNDYSCTCSSQWMGEECDVRVTTTTLKTATLLWRHRRQLR